MDRRQFIFAASSLAIASRASAGRAEAIPVARPDSTSCIMPTDFLGLSYETPQLYNPAYFAPSNKALVETFRNLAPAGVLRFGGSLSAFSRWKRPGADFATIKEETAIAAQRNWEWKLLDPALSDPQTGAITPGALKALRGFLDATGWRCIYGLNFGSGSIARAVDEADHVLRILGPRLLCFQLGNEVDFWAGNPLLRPNPYPFEQYWREYENFVGAIRERHPNAPFAGPDVAVNTDWMTRYAQLARGEALFASAHYYAMGPASDPAMNAERLLAANNPKLEHLMASVADMTASTGMPFRMTEANSCFGGGKPGVSDSFASALWGLDFLLETASAGILGVDLHGGGEGYYTPIASEPDGPEPRPLFHAMQMAAHFCGTRLQRCQLATDANATAYLGEQNGVRKLVIINKSTAPQMFAVRPALGPAYDQAEALLMHAPSLDDRSGTSIDRFPSDMSGAVTVPPYSAILLRCG